MCYTKCMCRTCSSWANLSAILFLLIVVEVLPLSRSGWMRFHALQLVLVLVTALVSVQYHMIVLTVKISPLHAVSILHITIQKFGYSQLSDRFSYSLYWDKKLHLHYENRSINRYSILQEQVYTCDWVTCSLPECI